jgi:hypothetical protein
MTSSLSTALIPYTPPKTAMEFIRSVVEQGLKNGTIKRMVTTGFENYIMSSSNQIENMRRGGRFNQSIIVTYTDKSEWVFLGDKQRERFCGFLYLQNALKESSLNKIHAAANKMAIHDKKIIYLSGYCGETKPGFFDLIGQVSALNTDIGFTDTAGGANLRKIDNEIFVFDTEKSSFASKVHEKIDAFVKLHDAIRSSLEDRLEN